MRVLLAEDDPHMQKGIVDILESEGYEVRAASDGEAALLAYAEFRPDFICLDIMMPLKNGYDVCREIRKQDRTVPIVFLSAKSEEIDKVLGLELGADDYLMKPFGMKEFVARIRAISRRCISVAPESEARTTFQIGPWEVFPDQLRAKSPATTVELSLREVRLLRVFADHPGAVLDRDQLFRSCWGGAVYPNSRTLDQHISKLRKKVEQDPKRPTLIQTVHGAGYRHEPA